MIFVVDDFAVEMISTKLTLIFHTTQEDRRDHYI